MGLMKKLTSVVVTAVLLLGLVGTAFAAYPADAAPAAARLQDFGIVQGDAGGLRLGDSITRAELIKIIVWAFGKGNDAKFLKGAPAFPDTANHWASGEIALAKNLIEANGFKLGMPDGTFAPQNNVTVAEAIAMVMKFLGAPADATQAWPNDYLNGAVAAGILSAADKDTLAATANAPATRGLVFYMADTAFSSYKLASGKTVYTQYVRPTAPTLTVDEIAPTTDSSVTVTGSVSSSYTGTLTVTVGSATNVATVSNGKFTATVSDLAIGDNNVSVMVTDEAGNVVTQTVKVTRTVGTPAAISADSAITVAAGQSVALNVAVKDDKGNVIADAPVTLTSTLGSLADGQFTAGTAAGTETATVASGDLTASVAVTVTAGPAAKVVVSPATANIGTGIAQKFTAQVTDEFGNAIADAAVSFSATGGIIDQNGNFAATAAGNATITASAAGFTGTATASIFGAAAALKMSAPADMVANGSDTTTFTVSVVDAAGNPVTTSSPVITVRANNNGDFGLGDAGVNSMSVQSANGSATFTVGSLSNPANDVSTVLTASADGLTGANVTVKAVKQVLTSIGVSADPATIGADGASTSRLTYKEYDQKGVALGSTNDVSVTVNLTNSDTTIGTLDNSGFTTTNYYQYINVNGKAKPGSLTVTGVVTSPAAYTNVPVSSVTVTTSAVYTPTQITMDAISDKSSAQSRNDVSDYLQAVKVRIKDMNGNQVANTGYNTNTTLSLQIDASSKTKLHVYKSSDATDEIGTGTTVNGAETPAKSLKVTLPTTARGAVTVYVAASYAQTLTYTATGTYTAGSTTLTSATGTGVIKAGNPAKIALTPDRSNIAGTNLYLPADGATNGSVTVEVTDTNGNTVSGGYALTVKKVTAGFNGAATATQSFSDLNLTTMNGSASFAVTASLNNNGDDIYQVVDNDPTVTLAPQPIHVYTHIIGSPFKLGLPGKYEGGSMPTFVAGKASSVYVGVYDANSNIVATDNATAAHLKVQEDNANGSVVAEYDATAVNGILTFPVTLNSTADTATYYYEVTSSNLQSDNVTSTLTPGSASQVTVSVPLANIAYGVNSTGDLRIKIQDANGNTVPTGADTITVTLDQASYVRFAGDAQHVNPLTGVLHTIYSNGAKADATNKTTYTWVSNREVTLTLDAADKGDVTFKGALVADQGLGSTVVSATSAANYVTNSVTVSSISVSQPQRLVIQTPDAVTAGSSQTLYIDVLDYNGNRVNTVDGADLSVTVTSTKPDGTAGPTTTVPQQTASWYNGRATVSVNVANAGTWSYNIANATYKGLNIGSASMTGVVNSGAVTGLAFTAQGNDVILANGSDTYTYTVKAVDAGTNTVTSYNGDLEFQVYIGNDYISLLNTTAPMTNGVGYVTVRAKNMVGNATLQARVANVTDAMHAWTSTTVKVTAAAASNVILAQDLSGLTTKAAGDAMFQVRDAYGNGVKGVAITFTVKGTGAANYVTSVDTQDGKSGDNGYITVTLTPGVGAADTDSVYVEAKITVDGIDYTAQSTSLDVPVGQ